ncbi:MAG: hypothetical protein IJW65_02150 [Clostridia bacterium]|nr:hypothetical protein [Clostridia bacterium]
MEKFKKIMKKLLYPRFYVVIPTVILSAVLLIYTFASGIPTESPVAIISYVISVYALTVVCVGIVPLIKKIMEMLHANPYSERFMTDAVLRAKVSLLCGLAFNLIYAAFNIFMGIRTSSVWLIAIALYYAAVAIIRFAVTLGVRKSGTQTSEHARLIGEWRRYRAAGWASLLMTSTMSAMIALVLFEDEGFTYPGYFIFVFAAYTFIKFTASIVNTVKFRKLDTPVLSAAKALDLSVAVMSLFALQTAMFAEFGSGESMFQNASDTAEQMSQADMALMNTMTGIAVWCTALAIAIFMIIHSGKKLKKLASTSDAAINTDTVSEENNGQ